MSDLGAREREEDLSHVLIVGRDGVHYGGCGSGPAKSCGVSLLLCFLSSLFPPHPCDLGAYLPRGKGHLGPPKNSVRHGCMCVL